MNRPRAQWLLLAAALVAATTVLPAAAGQGAGLSTATVPLRTASDYADLESPGAHILFGSPLPAVEILPKANESISATLGLEYLLEITPNGSDPARPTIVREAAPETLQHFNNTISPGNTSINLIATLPVYPADSALWADGSSVTPTGIVAQQAILDVNYSIATGSDGSPGVLVSWSVSGWPWASSAGDDLALEYVVQIGSGSGFASCAGTPSSNAPSANCQAQPLYEDQPVWGSTALKGEGPSGSVAWVSWSPILAGSSAASTSVQAGAYMESPDTSDLVVAAAADGASSVMGTTLFLLSPGPTGLVSTLAGDLPVYGGAAVVFIAAAGTGIGLSRRRDRKIERELSE